MTEPNLKFLDFSNNKSHALPPNRITLCIDDKNTRRLIFCEQLNEVVNNGYCFLRVGYNEYSSDLYFIFCKTPTPDALVVPNKAKKIAINSKFLVESIIERMGLERKGQYLNVPENLAKTTDYCTFRISK